MLFLFSSCPCYFLYCLVIGQVPSNVEVEELTLNSRLIVGQSRAALWECLQSQKKRQENFPLLSRRNKVQFFIKDNFLRCLVDELCVHTAENK